MAASYAAIPVTWDEVFFIVTTLAALATIVSFIPSSLRLNGKEYLKIRFTTVENCLGNEPVL
jgi:hypothetical protein